MFLGVPKSIIVRLGWMTMSYGTVLVLRHYENLKLREIADVLDIPDGTVNSRMAEGLAQLTRLLEPQFGRKTPQAAKAPRQIKSQEILAL